MARGKIPETAETLVQITGVSEVYSVTGEYDLVALVRVKEYDDLAVVVTGKIANIPAITRTTTMLAFKVYNKADIEESFHIGVG